MTRTEIEDWQVVDGAAAKMYLVWFKCPGCAVEVGVGRRHHTVGPNGDVNPSAICPHCGFHGWVRLAGWVPVEVSS